MNIKEIAEKYNKPEKEFLRRLDGRIEWVCEHGVGHTIWYPTHMDNVHTCCGCCERLEKG